MATLNPPLKYRNPAVYAESMQFQRGLEKIPVKKIQRKLTVRSKHILLFFFVVMAIFYGLMRLYLFLITWDELNVRKTQVTSRHDFVVQELESMLKSSKLGNLLVLDIARLQDQIESHRWVKEARLRKVFPSTLKIEIQERVPRAVLAAGAGFLLVDEDGVMLERLATRDDIVLPLLTDAADFRTAIKEKFLLAWDCLDSLTPEEQAAVESLDLSRSDSVSVTLKGQPTFLMLGTSDYPEKLRYYLSHKDQWESANGPLGYVDLRFDDRIYFKPLPVLQAAAGTHPKEEVE